MSATIEGHFQLRVRHCISLIVFLVMCGATAGAAIVWHSLGSTSVKATPLDAKAQPAEIRPMSARGPFESVRLEVEGGAILLDHLVITFAHGSTQAVEVRKAFESGSLTAEFQLTGTDRVIRKVAFWYTAPKFASVRLYAR